VYSFNATPGTELWLDLDRTSTALDSVLELVDENGAILAQAVRNDRLSGIAQTLNPNPLLVGVYYTHSIRDAGMRLLLPDVGFSEGTYYVESPHPSDHMILKGIERRVRELKAAALPLDRRVALRPA
jgi:hypothetical protein